MTKVFAIDPGPKQSAYVLLKYGWQILDKGLMDNHDLVSMVSAWNFDVHPHTSKLAIEYPRPRGQPMYTQLVDTICWIGRFIQASRREDWLRVDRLKVKMELCGSARANDAAIRAAVLSRYPAIGGGRLGQVGTKKDPGPLYGVRKDIWAALAVAITVSS